jgi:hypothetical protein
MSSQRRICFIPFLHWEERQRGSHSRGVYWTLQLYSVVEQITIQPLDQHEGRDGSRLYLGHGDSPHVLDSCCLLQYTWTSNPLHNNRLFQVGTYPNMIGVNIAIVGWWAKSEKTSGSVCRYRMHWAQEFSLCNPLPIMNLWLYHNLADYFKVQGSHALFYFIGKEQWGCCTNFNPLTGPYFCIAFHCKIKGNKLLLP